MAPKLGEVLVSEGLITQKQLEEALKCQVIFGGRLGTNLIEMNMVEESELLRCLSKRFDMPSVSPEQLMSVTPDIIKLIPKEIAEEFKIIPLSLEKKRLTVAMYDPSDLAAIDAISFMTGYIILPVVCSELRLLLALEQYYGIKREVRYIKLSGGTGIRSRETGAPVETKKEDDIFPDWGAITPSGTSNEPSASDVKPQELAEWGDLPEILPSDIPAAPVPNQVDLQPLENLPLEEPEILDLEEPAQQPQAKLSQPSAAADVKVEETSLSLDDLLSELAEARDRDAIADAVAAYVCQNAERVALFMVKGKMASGWKARIRKKAVQGFENFQLTLDEPSALKVVADTKSFYLGPMLDTAGNQKILAALGGGAPESALLMPLMMMGRVVTIFYVDGGKELAKNLESLQKVAGKAALAFEILILKNKILLA